jgi:hypothetical protein
MLLFGFTNTNQQNKLRSDEDFEYLMLWVVVASLSISATSFCDM